MIDFMKICVLLLASVAAVLLECRGKQKHLMSLFLIFFVAIGTTSFLAGQAWQLQLVAALSVFGILSLVAKILSRRMSLNSKENKKHKTL